VSFFLLFADNIIFAEMKLLCLIFSVMALMLSANPCCTDQDCEREAVTLNPSAGKHAPKQDTCPGCSPFFSCGLCAGFILNKPAATLNQCVTEKPARGYPPYQHPAFHEITLAIWQPPKLG
jgi:hypothetical protein